MPNLSQAEIWDDSSLVDSWNDAVQEYDRYHSMHARGEKVEDVINAQDTAKKNVSSHGGIEGQSDVSQVFEDNEVDMESHAHVEDTAQNPSSRAETQASAQSQTAGAAPALPQHLIGQVHDEGLKNLLMSWYYAGYYTGLYEGQRQAQAKQE